MFGYEVDSDVELARLRESEGTRGTIRIESAAPGSLDESIRVTALDHLSLPDGSESTFAVGQAGERTLCGCSHTGFFRIDPDALLIEVDPQGGQEMWEHRLLSVIVPILLSLRGEVALHAGAVEIGGRAVAFCGPPMRGKSTLALTFAELGYPVISEDGVVLESRGREWIAWPAAAGVRIRGVDGDAAPSKAVRALPGPEARPVALGGLLLLRERGGDGAAVEIDGASALVGLAPHLMHSGGVESVRPAFAELAGVVGALPSFAVSLPDEMSQRHAAASGLAEGLSRLVGGEA